MTRSITLFTGQWADLPLDRVCAMAADWGFDGLELACWGDHLDVNRVLQDDDYAAERRHTLSQHGLELHAIANHLVGQAVCDELIDERHQAILLPHVWGEMATPRECGRVRPRRWSRRRVRLRRSG